MRENYSVFDLYSKTFNRHYTGYTSNLDARIESHNVLSNKGYTFKYRPWVILFTKEFDNKAEAMEYEKWLKSGVGRAYINEFPH